MVTANIIKEPGMKNVGVVMMVVLGLTGLVYGTPLFSDSFDAGWTGWNVGYAGTGSVTQHDGYAELYESSGTWGYSSLSTQEAFSVGQGLQIDVTLLFPMNEPGYSSAFVYCPNMTLQDSAGTAHVGVYSPFGFGSTSAPQVMQTLNSGTMADAHTTPAVGTSGWYLYNMEVYTDHINVKVLENGITLRDQWTSSYNPMTDVKVAFSADCPGWWPDARLLVNDVQISTIPEPATLILLGLSALFGIRRK
jgi:hypothetical protein